LSLVDRSVTAVTVVSLTEPQFLRTLIDGHRDYNRCFNFWIRDELPRLLLFHLRGF